MYFIPIALPIYEPAALVQFYKKRNTERTGALKWEDLKNHPLPQDFADMLGWEEMAIKMAAAYNTLDSNEKKHTILFCDNYGQAGAVNYYGKKVPSSACTQRQCQFFILDCPINLTTIILYCLQMMNTKWNIPL